MSQMTTTQLLLSSGREAIRDIDPLAFCSISQRAQNVGEQGKTVEELVSGKICFQALCECLMQQAEIADLQAQKS